MTKICPKCTREFEKIIDERIEFYKINFYEDAEEHMKVFNLAARELLKELRAKLRAGTKQNGGTRKHSREMRGIRGMPLKEKESE